MRNYLMLLWHMHQPFYKDLAGGVYTMPWVRLHALKDYYGMVAMLKDFPNVHVTFNMVPSLVLQLEEYARDDAKGEEFTLAFKPAVALTGEDRAKLIDFAFCLNWENLLNRYPRFRELHEKSQAGHDLNSRLRLFSVHDLLDLQVLSQVAWFDEIYLAEDDVLKGLVKKERGFSEEDKARLRAKEIEIIKVTLEEYRRASERRQIEISTSPFYHPILPLLCDTNIALESHPGVSLPLRRFAHPEDAEGQLRAAVQLHERVFGCKPRGLWPSEGSVSDEVLRLAAAGGFSWTATDEGVLARSLQMGFHRQPDGTVWGGNELYRPHRFEAEEKSISLFFRDHQLSDLIGFVYSRLDAQAAAADLHQRIRCAVRSTGNKPAVISVILDGENAWEFFPGNGREFLKSFYGHIAADPELQAVTPSEVLGLHQPGEAPLVEPGKLKHVVPGSWINSNFDVWIGAEEDNRAWDLLEEAREFFARNSANPNLKAEDLSLAQQELWIAEGSDWNWWYGPEHSSAHDEEFDLLYRKHLSNIYLLLGGSPPEALAAPVKHLKAEEVIVPPQTMIAPTVDGQVTNYFEWLGAGLFTPDKRTGSMHGAAQFLDALYYGYSGEMLYLRLDFNPSFLSNHSEFEIRVTLNAETPSYIHIILRDGKLGLMQLWKGSVMSELSLASSDRLRAGFGRVLEIGMGYELMGLKLYGKASVQVSVWVNELPVQIIPHDGWLNIELTDNFER